jgi:hypothetical protein
MILRKKWAKTGKKKGKTLRKPNLAIFAILTSRVNGKGVLRADSFFVQLKKVEGKLF